MIKSKRQQEHRRGQGAKGWGLCAFERTIVCAIIVIGSQVCRAGVSGPNTVELVEKSRAARNELFRANFGSLGEDRNSAKQVEEKIAILQETLTVVKIKAAKASRKQEAQEQQVIAEPVKKLEPKKDLGGFDEAALKTIMASDANTVKEPLELAEILFNTGHLKEAARYYKASLKRREGQKEISDDDKAWMLFQLANCSKDDPNTASAYLGELVRKYPNSSFAHTAGAQKELLNWYRQERPQSVIGAGK